ncbi:MAG TPA: MarP family serine protease [Candidatus Saccharimonadales bacterium]|nr:MarP family serine protease [Candidatus Saccharimonadales bacterium]
MNLIDVLIVLFTISSLTRGYQIGLIRQAGSTIGFIVGLFLGSQLSNLIVSYVHGALNKSLTSLLVVLVCSFMAMSLGEIAGIRLKQRLGQRESLNKFDGSLGSVMAAATLLFAIWLGAAILVLAPASGFQQAIKSSRILGLLDSNLPPATKVISSLNKLIDPNGFPQVFRGLEPNPGSTKVPELGTFANIVDSVRPSVVKLEGTGCGGIVEGSGFVVADDLIATNAHVIAGVEHPKVIDDNGVHNTRVIWFDPDVDLAVLRVADLAGRPLHISSDDQPDSTPGVVLGYPGGGDFDAQPAAVISHFDAYGRNIYGQGSTTRDVYSVQAKIIPGNSGGPLVAANGTVLGIVFATSTTYNNVGYALTGHQVASELATAEQSRTTYGTGSCSE